MKTLITGGAGFIGSNLIKYLIERTNYKVINIDNLTYAGNPNSLDPVKKNKRYTFEQIDITNKELLSEVFHTEQPDSLLHLAAESHVDRSIQNPEHFVKTNIYGTYNLLEVTREYLKSFPIKCKDFKFIHISTDEVYGDLEIEEKPFTEESPYFPSSPYSASKASSDHLVRAWHRTYNLPTIITNCSNNYGPFQFPEKLIPLTIVKALEGRKIPVYGDGKQIRDWLYVKDHIRALMEVLKRGIVGETYNIGGNCQISNIEVIKMTLDLIEEFLLKNEKKGNLYNLIEFVEDRPGHDLRYAIDISKIKRELQWEPKETINTGLRKTVEWYLSNKDWTQIIKNKFKNKK